MCETGENRRIKALHQWLQSSPFTLPPGAVLAIRIHWSLPPWLSDQLGFAGGDEDYLVICNAGDYKAKELLGTLDDKLTICDCEEFDVDGFRVLLTCHS